MLLLVCLYRDTSRAAPARSACLTIMPTKYDERHRCSSSNELEALDCVDDGAWPYGDSHIDRGALGSRADQQPVSLPSERSAGVGNRGARLAHNACSLPLPPSALPSLEPTHPSVDPCGVKDEFLLMVIQAILRSPLRVQPKA